jgi:hypothetical protein
MTRPDRLPVPAVILAADHRARGVVTIENYGEYVEAAGHRRSRPATASWPRRNRWPTWPRRHISPRHRTYLSLNRTGLAGSVFELDDRLVASVPRAGADGWTGVKHMTRIDMADPGPRRRSSCWARCSSRPGRPRSRR